MKFVTPADALDIDQVAAVRDVLDKIGRGDNPLCMVCSFEFGVGRESPGAVMIAKPWASPRGATFKGATEVEMGQA
jgi:hypothetical protein